MANNITCNATFQVSTPGGTPNIAIAVNVPMNGINATWTVQNLPSGSWTPLDTGSLSDLRYLAGDNIGTGSIQIATDSAGSKIISTLAPNDCIMVPFSGSISLYSRPINSGSVFTYVVAES